MCIGICLPETTGRSDITAVIYGYIRVSSQDQDEGRHVIALKEAGVSEKTMYVDKQSGKDFKRPQYKKLLRKLKANDVLYIKSIDRLGRNYAEGIAAAKARGVRFGRVPKPLPDNFHSIYQQWKNGELTGTEAAKECRMPLSTVRYRAEIYRAPALTALGAFSTRRAEPRRCG